MFMQWWTHSILSAPNIYGGGSANHRQSSAWSYLERMVPLVISLRDRKWNCCMQSELVSFGRMFMWCFPSTPLSTLRYMSFQETKPPGGYSCVACVKGFFQWRSSKMLWLTQLPIPWMPSSPHALLLQVGQFCKMLSRANLVSRSYFHQCASPRISSKGLAMIYYCIWGEKGRFWLRFAQEAMRGDFNEHSTFLGLIEHFVHQSWCIELESPPKA